MQAYDRVVAELPDEQVVAGLPNEQVVDEILLEDTDHELAQDQVFDELSHDLDVKEMPLAMPTADSETTETPKDHHRHHHEKLQQPQQLVDVLSRYEDTPGLRSRTNKSGRALGNVVSLRQLRHMLLDTPRPFKLQNCHNYYPV